MFRSLSILSAAAVSLLLMGASPLRTSPFHAHGLPGGPPRVQLVGKASGDVSRTALLADPAVHLHGCVATARVVAFSFKFTNGAGKIITHRTHEAGFTKEMIAELNAMPVGSSFIITDLEVKDGEGTAYKVPEASFTLRA